MTDLNELLERVKAATGPDRELDVDIAWTVEPERYRSAYWNGRTGKPGTTLPLKLDGMGRMSVRSNCPSFTASIDASIALVERACPGGLLDLTLGYEPGVADKAWPAVTLCFYPPGVDVDGKRYHARIASAPTPSLAILAALLQALISQEQK